jgi:hypothetical protein
MKTSCWSWWKSTKILMGAFISLKYMLLFSTLLTGWEASSFNEECWFNGYGTYGQAFQALHPHQEGQK